MNYRDLSNEWLNYAIQDLASAHFLRKMKPQLPEIICFHCQQAAEKALKAYLALHKKNIPYIHDLTVLNRSCAEIDDKINELYSSCEQLNDFSVKTRYPTDHELSEKDIPEALRNASKILDFVKAELA
ncbi:hypothetical protein ES708_34736 [subsurface metagenome]